MLAKKFFLGGKINAPLDPTLQAVIDYADANSIARPTGLTLFALNRFIIKEKANGNFATNDVYLNFIYNNDALANFARICWKRLILVDVYVATYSATKGFVTYLNNINAYIDTLFNPVTAGGNYTANSAHFGGVVSEVLSGNANFTGLETTNFRNFLQIGNNLNQRINSTIAFTPTFDFSGAGYKMMNRTSSSNVIVQNRANQETRTQTQNSFISEKQMIGKAGSNFGAMNFGAFSMGGALTSTQITARRQHLKDYYNEIGLTTLSNAI
jgi:hypothetical protein